MATDVDLVDGLVRIRVPLERTPGEEGPADDWLWAEPLGSGRYRVESCPFFAYGISREDVVRVAAPAGGEAPLLEDVVEKCGHRTLRLALDPDVELTAPEIRALLDQVLELGCTHELMRPKLVAIDVPPQADVERVAALLQALTRDGALLWEWADPRPC